MPRCPKGTRKNKKTGICEKNNTSRKQQLEGKLKKCLDDYEKLRNKKNKNLTEQKKYHKLYEKCMDLDNKIENLNTDKHLTEKDVLDIMAPYNIAEEDKESIKQKLMALTYSEKYKSCFTGKKSSNLYHMADDKLACFFKFGDQI